MQELMRHYEKFENIGTCFGWSSRKNLYLNCLDLDSQNAIDALSEYKLGRTEYPLLESIQRRSWLTRTRKGFHAYWFSKDALTPVHTENIKEPEWAFEIKTDKTGGLCHLPPSVHRHDSSFVYENVGQPFIGVNDQLYDQIMQVLGKHVRIKVKQDYVPSKRPDVQREIYSLNDTERAEIATLVVRKAYAQGLRHQTALAVSGMLLKSGINFDSAMQVFEDVIRLSKDEEKRERYATLKETYRKPVGARVAGYAKLHEISRDAAERIANILGDVIKRGKEA